jgi:hypothetical protein
MGEKARLPKSAKSYQRQLARAESMHRKSRGTRPARRSPQKQVKSVSPAKILTQMEVLSKKVNEALGEESPLVVALTLLTAIRVQEQLRSH